MSPKNLMLRMWTVESRGRSEQVIVACTRHNALQVRDYAWRVGFVQPVVRRVADPRKFARVHEFALPSRCDLCGRFGRWPKRPARRK